MKCGKFEYYFKHCIQVEFKFAGGPRYPHPCGLQLSSNHIATWLLRLPAQDIFAKKSSHRMQCIALHCTLLRRTRDKENKQTGCRMHWSGHGTNNPGID